MAVVKFDILRSLAFSGISGAYAPIGGPTLFNWRIFKITNNTNGDLFITDNGVDDKFFLPANSFTLYDISTNALPVQEADYLVVNRNVQFSVRQSTAPTSGAVYIEAAYTTGV